MEIVVFRSWSSPSSGDTVTCQVSDMVSDIKLSVRGKVPVSIVCSLPWEPQLSFSINRCNDRLTDWLAVSNMDNLFTPPHWKHAISVVIQNSFIQNWLHIYIPHITFWFCLSTKICQYKQQYELPTSLFYYWL